MNTDYLCAFCRRATEDDPRRVELQLSFAGRARTEQRFGSHWRCLEQAMHPLTAEALTDPCR